MPAPAVHTGRTVASWRGFRRSDWIIHYVRANGYWSGGQ